MLPDDRRDNLHRFAREVLTWLDGYVRVSGLTGGSYLGLFNRGRTLLQPNDLVRALFRYAVELHTGAQAEPDIDPLGTVVHADHPRPPSWLLRQPPDAQNPNGSAVIRLDRLRILGTVPQNISRLVNYLCLHEIGHAFLHWESFFTGTRQGPAPHATARQEAEAWCFCFALATLIAEQVAEDYRNAAPASRHSLDHVWEMVSELRI